MNGARQDIEGKYVRLRPEAHKPEYRDPKFLVFKAEGGFGCSPETRGTAVIGYYVCDGERARVEGWDVVEVLTEDEAKKIAEVA